MYVGVTAQVRIKLAGAPPAALWSRTLQRLDIAANAVTSLAVCHLISLLIVTMCASRRCSAGCAQGLENCVQLAELNASHNSLVEV